MIPVPRILFLHADGADDEAADVVYALDDAGQVWVGHWISDDVFDWGAPLPSLPDQTPSEVPPDGEG